MTQSFTFIDPEQIKSVEESNTIMTDERREERREEFRKIKFGLVKPTPFQELLKIA